ncbi:MAG TPA: hypothetical protein VGG10_12695 [Rhizomicrobium sp.]|jgi:tetratricopeptide (TPR) repeat protein
MTVLRALAESLKPETEARLADYLHKKLNYNRLGRALRSLRNLNLIVVKTKPDSADVVELHPLVREFIRQRFPRQERIAFIEPILSFYLRFIGQHRTELDHGPSFTVLQNWTESAELDLGTGRLERAFERMAEAASAFESSAFINEFARVCKMLFKEIDWKKLPPTGNLDRVLGAYVRILGHLGRNEDADLLLEKFETTLTAKDTRYINYCGIRCYLYWICGDFNPAVEWGKRGQELKIKSGVDTAAAPEYNLALAQRDAGDIDPALSYFLSGRTLSEVTDPDELDEERGAPHYGNIGRCLHLMGQIDPALICYRKSAVLLERSKKHGHTTNEGYIRQWIGELYIDRNDVYVARNFLIAARQRWEQVFPPRVAEISARLSTIENAFSDCKKLSEEDCERYCKAWIYGREDEFLLK